MEVILMSVLFLMVAAVTLAADLFVTRQPDAYDAGDAVYDGR